MAKNKKSKPKNKAEAKTRELAKKVQDRVDPVDLKATPEVKDVYDAVWNPEGGAAVKPPLQFIPVEEQIRRRQEEIRNLQAKQVNISEIPCEVTVVIPCFNAFTWLGQVLNALSYGEQSIPLKIILCDNGSTDPMKSVLTTEPGATDMAKWLRSLGFADVQILTPVTQKDVGLDGVPMEPQEKINKNLEHLWKKLTMAVDTKYIWYVDGDVVPPKDCGRVMRDMLDADPELAFVGVMYDYRTDHVKMGCSVGRTSVMQELDFSSMGCPCRWVNYALKSKGHKVEHVSPTVNPRDSHGMMVAFHGRHLEKRARP